MCKKQRQTKHEQQDQRNSKVLFDVEIHISKTSIAPFNSQQNSLTILRTFVYLVIEQLYDYLQQETTLAASHNYCNNKNGCCLVCKAVQLN